MLPSATNDEDMTEIQRDSMDFLRFEEPRILEARKVLELSKVNWDECRNKTLHYKDSAAY